jgi:hypothetical protein
LEGGELVAHDALGRLHILEFVESKAAARQ